MESKLLDMRNATNLINLCEFSRHENWRRIYQGSTDGFSSAHFHEKCDGVPATLTIIKTTNGNIFGGYTDKPWNSKVTYRATWKDWFNGSWNSNTSFLSHPVTRHPTQQKNY